VAMWCYIFVGPDPTQLPRWLLREIHAIRREKWQVRAWRWFADTFLQ